MLPGSYGSLSKPVLQARNELTTLIERNPDKFMRLTFLPLFMHVRERLAKLIGAETDELVLIPNASHGINTVLWNFEWLPSDILVVVTTTYDSILKTAQYLSDRPPHPQVSKFKLEFPTTHAKIISSFRDHLRALPRRSSFPDKPQQVVAVIDSLVSNPGVLLPWKEMVKICREEGIFSVVDAAHSIGQEVGIDVGASGCDFWISNCHKWLFAERVCAMLYVPKRNQHIIKSAFPTAYWYVSPSDKHFSQFPRFVSQFEWNGTIDVIPYLTVGAALDFRQWLGGEEKINAYCHSLALAGGMRLAEILGTEVMHGKDEDELTLNMVNVLLPIPPRIKYTEAIDYTIRERLLNDWNTYVAHYTHNGKVWVRCSAQVWNEVSDFEYAGKALKAVCEEIVESHKDEL
ncbi:hypothetical protein PILCRDRAFT_823789 [Piloderma croceum F 1598]|uniref:Aminotransferase class V domain-containing protein n=1 Tax=Piloderma croceum (strain F 1598) TaxID=765440 RepID=A0A0C3FHZ0_PILCF|nr:hypothetical protein PILCRDRAFT_823789 [Piloderma croceum F 1598]